jgi:sugar phosphate isomerase/epimerase
MIHEEESPQFELAKTLGLNRRQFLAAATGVATAAAVTASLGPLASPAFANGGGGHGAANSALIPPSKRGIILYTVRDVVGRDPLANPALPAGFRRVFEALSKIGYEQIEFAGYGQHANSPGGANLGTVEGAGLLRSWLDDNGLKAQGNHGGVPSTLTPQTLAAFDRECEIANILGLEHVGTGGDPTGSAYKADWDLAIDRWNILGRRASRHGLKLYTHNHDVAYSFLLDRGPLDDLGRPTRSSGVRRLEYFIDNTDKKHVWFEMDIYWAYVARYKHRTYTAPDGSTRTDVFDPFATVRRQSKRFPLFHAKDGKSNTGVPNGYDMVPFGVGDIDFQSFFSRLGNADYHNPMWEQDTAPGGAANPGQSLDFAELSYRNIAALRRPRGRH